MKSILTCPGCKYYAACGDIERTAPCNGKEISETVEFDEREIPLQLNVRSIFDERLGGFLRNSREYFIRLLDENGDEYAIPSGHFYFIKANGETLEYGESAVFYGQKVRGMSESEEREWDEGGYDGLHIVDLWGNMKEE